MLVFVVRGAVIVATLGHRLYLRGLRLMLGARLAVASLALRLAPTLLFAVAMLAGMSLQDKVAASSRARGLS